MNSKRKAYIASCEVSSLESAMLGSFKQKFLIEGKSKSAPIVLTLHGGPGSPIPFSVGCRGLFPDFSDRFLMVYWDQLGCGINNYVIDDTFTVSHFVQMTVDLIKWLKGRFPKNKLYLLGMSWGSILSLRAAGEVPELLDGVLASGQVLTAPLLSDETFKAIAASSAPEKVKREAEAIRGKDAPGLKEMARLSGIVRKYTDGYTNKLSKPAPTGEIIKGLLTSPDYSLKDFLAIVKNGYAKNESLLREMANADLKEALSGVQIPYHIFQGESDIVTATKDVQSFMSGCNNKNVTLTILPQTGHFPTAAAMGLMFDDLCQMAGAKA